MALFKKDGWVMKLLSGQQQVENVASQTQAQQDVIDKQIEANKSLQEKLFDPEYLSQNRKTIALVLLGFVGILVVLWYLFFRESK